MATLSIIIPAFNEEATIVSILNHLKEVTLIGGLNKEIIIVNDYSTDGTDERVLEYLSANPQLDIKYFKHVIIQDADLEYDPNEFNILLKPMLRGVSDVVYGSRFMGGDAHRILFFWHSIGNKFLTFLSNMFTNLNLTDMETCYKLFRREIIQSLALKEKRFGFEPEVTAKISRIPKIRIYEVGISYYGRTFEEGKKISWKDGFRAIYCVLKYNLFSK
jgi:glycosyltransferase involved in cell wall biosynthesis